MTHLAGWIPLFEAMGIVADGAEVDRSIDLNLFIKAYVLKILRPSGPEDREEHQKE